MELNMRWCVEAAPMCLARDWFCSRFKIAPLSAVLAFVELLKMIQ